ncbi:MAG: DNA methyltransferase [Meiothermus sp.]|nr:DNA methyltransferase [Meiothermus sp.]
MQERLLESDDAGKARQTVKCLGLSFENDEARREHFLKILAEKLKDPDFRKIPGFPIGKDEDILALSDPPYYTACPNPFLTDFVAHHGRPYEPDRDNYRREPFASDMAVGKSDPIYRAHSYHTKVPHLAIVPFILHYTEPGDLVLDGFAGSGMTGVASQWCGTAPREYRQSLEAEWQIAGRGAPRWGGRRVVLNDLSPIATFISANYNLPFDTGEFANAGRRLLEDVESELGWMYETRHTNGLVGKIEYTVWSEVFSCPACSAEMVFLDEALDEDSKRVKDAFPCPNCAAALKKDTLERMLESRIDPATGKVWQRIKLKPSLISYIIGDQRYEKKPDAEDLALLAKIEKLALPNRIPTDRFPIEEMYHGSRIAPKGFTHVHHFFLPRAAQTLGLLWSKATAQTDHRLKNMLLYFVEQAIWGMSVLARYAPTHYSQVNRNLNGVYYIGSQIVDVSPSYILDGKLTRLVRALGGVSGGVDQVSCTTGSASKLILQSNSIDYIFTDPPFGGNIYYADLNFLVESWHKVITNASSEAIVDRLKSKGLPEYQQMMEDCFGEYYRVLKPGRWMTVVFSNSSSAVWNAIQYALTQVGFVVADVRVLDKQQGSYRQVTSMTAVKQDLVISAYKPGPRMLENIKRTAGTEDSAFAFIQGHLGQLPVFVAAKGKVEVIAERTEHTLFDRMVAYHVQNNMRVPMDKPSFVQGLRSRFFEEDGMFFLPEQVGEYRTQKQLAGLDELEQAPLFVQDERSAIAWIRQELSSRPQTRRDIYTEYLQALQQSDRRNQIPELDDLLAENFLQDDQGRWYVPDPARLGDLEKLRQRGLLRVFKGYLEGRGVATKGRNKGQLETYRMDAVKAGFEDAWNAGRMEDIVAVGKMIPESVIYEDPELTMYFDNARIQLGNL